MLAVRGVWAGPPGVTEPTVRGVSFELARGEWLAVTGPNGCGKSTLALAVAGLWPVERGSVEVGGTRLEPTAQGRAAAGLASVLQEPASQLFERTVADEIAFAARNLGVTGAELAARVSEWSSRLGLADLLERDPHGLSAGWQQRVLLAGALASAPRVLVADEGAAHLDAAARTLVLEVIRDQVSQGLTVLWVTQDSGERAAAGRVVAMDGRSALEGAAGSAADEPPVPGPIPATAALGGIKVRIDPDPTGSGRRVRTARTLEFTAAPGRPVALTGGNGAGKSVALEAIAGVRSCAQVKVEPGPATQRPVLAAQYPELQVFGETVAEELAFGADARGGDRAHAVELATQLLAELGLGRDILSRSTWALSSGERRLVQVTTAMVTPASAVLVDEPTCGLDPARGRKLGGILARWATQIPLLVATQDPDLVTLIAASEQRLGD